MSTTLQQIAELLNGRQYGDETTTEIEKLAKDNNIVILFGASDDLAEFRGAIFDEVGCYGGGVITANPEIKAFWMGNEPTYQTWSYIFPKDLQNVRFNIFEDEDKGTIYCEGAVFYKPENLKLL